MVDESQSFSIREEVVGNEVVLVLGGELDAHSARRLDDMVDDLLTRETSSLVIDLEQVSFIDSSGLRSLIRARQRLGDEPSSVRLRKPQPGTVRLLEITGLLEHFAVA